MQDRFADFRALGASVLGVCAASPPLLASFLAENPSPFPLVTDPSRDSYRALGMGRTSWKEILRPGVVLGYLRLLLRGWRPRRPSGGEDIMQLGGDFVLDSRRRLVYSHPSRIPTDRPDVEELLWAVRAACAVVGNQR